MHAVLRSSNCFEQIVNRIPLALVILDKDRRIVFANKGTEALFDFPTGPLVGQGIEMLLSQESMDAGIPSFDHAFQRELLGRRKDGQSVPVEVWASPLKSSSGALTLVCFTGIGARLRADADEQHMSAIIDSAEDAILTKNLQGQIKSWNPGAERLLGYRAIEVIGGPVAALIPPHLMDEERAILESIRDGQRISHFETVRRRRDGSDVHVSLTISPIRDRSGAVVGASKIMRNISARTPTEETLRRSNMELQRLNAELDGFVYTASHDLRSPLTNVASVAQWILDDDPTLGEQTRTRLLLIQARIERMKRLLNDIREFARSGNTQEAARPPISAAVLLADVIDSVDVPAGFMVHMDPVLAEVSVRRIPLVQVFHNLIGNAIKHHDRTAGTVRVNARAGRTMWRFSVIDDGPGIPSEYREEVFGMFKTLKPRDEVEGSGMGLALVKKLVQGMGGACGVEPAPTRGAEFWFDWPKLPVIATPTD